ncbi:hypothetical protein Tco_0264602 [Tanacetum coccineum]
MLSTPFILGILCHKFGLVYPSLDDFVEVNESVSESVVEKPTIETNEPKNARKENGAPTIEDWVSESKEEDVPKSKTATNNSNFTKKVNIVKGTKVNTTRPKAVLSTVKGTRVNTARPKAVLSVVKGNKGKMLVGLDHVRLETKALSF